MAPPLIQQRSQKRWFRLLKSNQALILFDYQLKQQFLGGVIFINDDH
jgi:hypothetical protein